MVFKGFFRISTLLFSLIISTYSKSNEENEHQVTVLSITHEAFSKVMADFSSQDKTPLDAMCENLGTLLAGMRLERKKGQKLLFHKLIENMEKDFGASLMPTFEKKLHETRNTNQHLWAGAIYTHSCSHFYESDEILITALASKIDTVCPIETHMNLTCLEKALALAIK